MPPAVHQLSLLLLPVDPETPAERVVVLRDRLRAEGWLDGDVPGARALVSGGFRRARLDRFEDVRFASNWQGGFRVKCPVDGGNVVAGFARALEAWRGGGPRTLDCACGRVHDLTELGYEPDAGFARGWLALLDVADATIAPEALALADAVLGGVRLVARRG